MDIEREFNTQRSSLTFFRKSAQINRAHHVPFQRTCSRSSPSGCNGDPGQCQAMEHDRSWPGWSRQFFRVAERFNICFVLLSCQRRESDFFHMPDAPFAPSASELMIPGLWRYPLRDGPCGLCQLGDICKSWLREFHLRCWYIPDRQTNWSGCSDEGGQSCSTK